MQLPRIGFALAALGLALTACNATDGDAANAAGRPDIVVLVVDGLRVDRLQRLLADPAVAPLATRLDGDGALRFARAYAPSSLAEQSLAALFSGRLPTHGGGIGLAEAQPAAEATTLASRLRRAGYRTAFVSQQAWAGRPGFTRGFDALHVAPAAGPGSGPALAEQALRLVTEDLGASSTEPERPRYLLVAHWRAPELGVDRHREQREHLQDDYDQAAAASLRDAAALLDGLARRAGLDHAVIVLTAGHGFELLDHGDVGAGFGLHEEAVRVPLLLRVPGNLSSGATAIDPPVSTARLLPTLLALADDAASTSDPDTLDESPVSLPLPLAATATTAATAAGTPPVIVELVVRERAIARAVVEGNTKYLQVLRDAPLADRAVIAAGYEELQAAMTSGAIPTPPLFGEPAREELLRLGSDPADLGETALELAAHAQVLSRLRAALRDYRRLCDSTGFAPPAITERMPIDPNDVRQLEALGYM